MNTRQDFEDPSIDLVLHSSLGVAMFAMWAAAVWFVL